MIPDFRYLVAEARKTGAKVIPSTIVMFNQTDLPRIFRRVRSRFQPAAFFAAADRRAARRLAFSTNPSKRYDD